MLTLVPFINKKRDLVHCNLHLRSSDHSRIEKYELVVLMNSFMNVNLNISYLEQLGFIHINVDSYKEMVLVEGMDS